MLRPDELSDDGKARLKMAKDLIERTLSGDSAGNDLSNHSLVLACDDIAYLVEQAKTAFKLAQRG